MNITISEIYVSMQSPIIHFQTHHKHKAKETHKHYNSIIQCLILKSPFIMHSSFFTYTIADNQFLILKSLM